MGSSNCDLASRAAGYVASMALVLVFGLDFANTLAVGLDAVRYLNVICYYLVMQVFLEHTAHFRYQTKHVCQID